MMIERGERGQTLFPHAFNARSTASLARGAATNSLTCIRYFPLRKRGKGDLESQEERIPSIPLKL